MKEINLTQGLKTQVDDDMYDELNQFNWYAHKVGNTYYAEREVRLPSGKRYMVKIHHLVIDKPSNGLVTDHIDGNGLHNERHNLRHVTTRQNCQNRKNQKRTSILPGVSWDKENKKWVSRIKIKKTQKNLGRFISEIDAFQAYKKAVESIGEKVIKQENI